MTQITILDKDYEYIYINARVMFQFVALCFLTLKM